MPTWTFPKIGYRTDTREIKYITPSGRIIMSQKELDTYDKGLMRFQMLVILILALVWIAAGCDSRVHVESKPQSAPVTVKEGFVIRMPWRNDFCDIGFRVVEIDGHTFILSQSNTDHRLQHSPDCKCYEETSKQ